MIDILIAMPSEIVFII